MPNGGSDCCATCWFNSKNEGEAGFSHAGAPGPASCTIRNLAIENPFYTYCANHPHRRVQQDRIPIGPVFIHDVTTGGRKPWQPSPDTTEVRHHLLALVSEIKEKPSSEYPLGTYADEVVVWQIGEFREARAVSELQRIVSFDPKSAEDGQFGRTRHDLVTLAQEALAKIGAA